MKKLISIIVIFISIFLVSCDFINTPLKDVSIDIFSNDLFVTYAAKANYQKDVTYTLELSTNIQNEDGTSKNIILQATEFIAKENTKILSDSILISDICDIIGGDFTEKNFKELEYTISIYNSNNDSAGTTLEID